MCSRADGFGVLRRPCVVFFLQDSFPGHAPGCRFRQRKRRRSDKTAIRTALTPASSRPFRKEARSKMSARPAVISLRNWWPGMTVRWRVPRAIRPKSPNCFRLFRRRARSRTHRVLPVIVCPPKGAWAQADSAEHRDSRTRSRPLSIHLTVLLAGF